MPSITFGTDGGSGGAAYKLIDRADFGDYVLANNITYTSANGTTVVASLADKCKRIVVSLIANDSTSTNPTDFYGKLSLWTGSGPHPAQTAVNYLGTFAVYRQCAGIPGTAGYAVTFLGGAQSIDIAEIAAGTEIRGYWYAGGSPVSSYVDMKIEFYGDR